MRKRTGAARLPSLGALPALHDHRIFISSAHSQVGDGVRRRRWYRTRQRTDKAAVAMQEKQRRVTANSKKLMTGLPDAEIQGWLCAPQPIEL